jgi:hypothetical protein
LTHCVDTRTRFSSGVLLPDVVENIVTGEWGCVAIMNIASLNDSKITDKWLEVVSITFELLVSDGRDVCISF